MPRLAVFAVFPVISRADAYTVAALARVNAGVAYRMRAAAAADPATPAAAEFKRAARHWEANVRAKADAIIAFNADALAEAERSAKAAERTRLRGWATTGRPER